MKHRRGPRRPCKPTSSPTQAMLKLPRSGSTIQMPPRPHPPQQKVLLLPVQLCMSFHASELDLYLRLVLSVDASQGMSATTLCLFGRSVCIVNRVLHVQQSNRCGPTWAVQTTLCSVKCLCQLNLTFQCCCSLKHRALRPVCLWLAR